MEIAVFGGGCFWCTEAIFLRLQGVTSVISGYAGGSTVHPTYDEVCEGTTGHAEVIRIEFDPQKISYETLLDVFFHLHDPTTLNRQGNDVGTQYRSIILTTSDSQLQTALRIKKEIDASHEYRDPIVTQIQPLDTFYPAENYHQRYYDSHQSAPYCSIVIDPKIQKLLKEYHSLLE